ncbi:MAG: LysR family transcriptional regulator, partial [Oscillospiraceae bacterium]
MDLISLTYFSELAKDLHFTKTAQRLYISQQTLSYHIKRLEDELGEPLFERRPALALTCAGEFVLSFAQVMHKEHDNLQSILFDISKQERGRISVGASMPRGNTFLPRVLPDFCREYPKVELQVIDGISSKLERMVEQGELDFAVVLAEEAASNL